VVGAERNPPRRAWTIVGEWELRDLWLGGRGLLLGLAFSVLLSVLAYLTATNTALNFLEQRESVNLTLQVAIAVGALLALISAADTVSGERERGKRGDDERPQSHRNDPRFRRMERAPATAASSAKRAAAMIGAVNQEAS
jgi:hypothetical protein